MGDFKRMGFERKMALDRGKNSADKDIFIMARNGG